MSEGTPLRARGRPISRAERSKTIEDLKRKLGPSLRTSEQIAPPPGLSTGWPKLDRSLLWRGFPKGAVSLMVSDAGGATSLWVRSAALVTKQNQWVAWVNDAHSALTPWTLVHRGVDLSKILCVAQPRDQRQLMWALQELMSLCLFEMIGCDLGAALFSDPQLLQLKRLAGRYQTALVLTTHAVKARTPAACALVLHFNREQVRVTRALHRSTPFDLERRDLYADTLPSLSAGRRALCG